MYVDLPEFKRCCFCIPLRRGLLTWGYFKLVSILFLFGSMIAMLEFERRSNSALWFEIALIIALLVEVGFTISFIVASHQKNYKLLKYYYYYSIVVFVIISVCLTINIGLNIYIVTSDCSHCIGSFFYMMILLTGIILKLFFILIQLYLILLIRSEIIKLKSNVQFKFVNVKNGDGTLGTDDKVTAEKVKYDRFESDNDSAIYNRCEL